MIWSLKKVWLSWKLALSSECSYLLIATIRTYIPKHTSMWTCFRICFWLFQDCVTDKCLKLSCWAIASPSYYCINTPRTEEHPWTLMKLPLAPLLLVFFSISIGYLDLWIQKPLSNIFNNLIHSSLLLIQIRHHLYPMKDAELLNSPTFILDILGPYPKGWEIWPKKDKASAFNQELV